MAWRTCLSLAIITAIAVSTAGNIAPGDLFSPDGVYLYDLKDHSAVWGRGFEYSVDQEEASAIFQDCAHEAAAHGYEVGFDECLLPYTVDIYWTVGGERVHSDAADEA